MSVLRDAGWVFLVTMWLFTLLLGPTLYLDWFWPVVIGLASLACTCFVRVVFPVE